MSPAAWFAGGLRFACRRCGRCCSGEPGYVFLRLGEAEGIAAALGLGLEAFFLRHTRRVPGGISLRERPDGRCAYLREGCAIYAARPRQCRAYPFWPRILASRAAWEREARECPGIGEGELHGEPEIRAALGPGRAPVLP